MTDEWGLGLGEPAHAASATTAATKTAASRPVVVDLSITTPRSGAAP